MAPTAISVHVRLRPSTQKDGPVSSDGIILNEGQSCDGGGSVSVPNPQNLSERLKFSLDACYGPTSTQEHIFECTTKPLLDQVFRGVNTTIFAYGVTGSGKTHTMQGSGGKGEEGVIPRVVKTIFAKKSRLRKSKLSISFSYVEILCEEIYDLLVPRAGGKKLDIRTTSTGENVVADLTRKEANSVAEFEQIYNAAAGSRKTASTNLNSTSSRSHAILTLYVETTELESEKTFIGKICLVDLAGSEDNNLTGNDPQRMRESAAINKSLTNLGSVVEALNKGAGRIPYRDSKLTRMLQDALGGSSVGILILNLAPGEKFAKDTLRTLKFATRTREVENRIVTNQRDDRQHAKPHFSAPTRPNVLRTASAVPAFKVYDPSAAANAQAGPSRQVRPPVKAAAAATASGQQNPMASITFSNRAPAILTEDLRTHIAKEVTRQMEEKQKEHAGDATVVKSTESAVDEHLKTLAKVEAMSREERKHRSHALVKLARTYQDGADLESAMKYYKEASLYTPENEKLIMRITEIQLALEGQLPIPKRAAAVQATAPPPVLKRSRAPLQPLSEFLKTSTSQPQPSEKEMKKSKPEGKDLMKSTMSINDEWEDKENHQMKKRKMKINDADEFIPEKKPRRQAAVNAARSMLYMELDDDD